MERLGRIQCSKVYPTQDICSPVKVCKEIPWEKVGTEKKTSAVTVSRSDKMCVACAALRSRNLHSALNINLVFQEQETQYIRELLLAGAPSGQTAALSP